jgi:hypothetical protein
MMPERPERLFWLQAKQADYAVAIAIDAANRQFVKSWTDSPVECVSAVTSFGVSDRLWLFRLGTGAQQAASRFNAVLGNHIKGLPSALGRPALKVKRQVNLPTPLVRDRLGSWPKTDIGLHVVNDAYNGMLVTFTYHEGRYYNSPHLQLVGVERIAADVRAAWGVVACPCHSEKPTCCGTGCFDCFQRDCPLCDGTGWKDFSRWAKGGYAIDYASGVPLARL